MAQVNKFFNSRTSLFVFTVSALFLAGACKDDDDGGGNMVKERSVEMETAQEIPTVPDRTEKGTANFKLYDDSTLNFNISVSNLKGSDQLTVAHIHTGGPVETGSPIITLVDNSSVKFQGSSASGTIKLNSTQFNSIKGEAENFYVNVHSTEYPLGLVRGQLDMDITYAQNIAMTPLTNTLRPETGTAIFRMASDSTLHYKVSVENLTTGDVLTTAQINVGATGVVGPAVIPLYATGTEFNTHKSMKLTGSQVQFLINSQVYVVANSEQVPNELLRGQLR